MQARGTGNVAEVEGAADTRPTVSSERDQGNLTEIAAVERPMELAQPIRPRTKKVVLEERRNDVLIEFQRLEDDAMVEDMPLQRIDP
ncbi:hypothetical protein CYMTET_54846 [Cymbomonas tetramitiformis]|uniref:Uncharacterized protein n=1 Tax=Cymbomonas tetramitiformis TaxID=36881 RepID=A0AAE0BFY3_9CHLO|nr:hypothetical protein CYMTET_54846 [Cymbomonas tetramitiformis]